MSQPTHQSPAVTAENAPAAPQRFVSSLAATTAWAVLAAAVLGIGCVPWLLSDPARVSRLIARAVPDLQADVTVGRARIGWTGPIMIEDVRVVPHSGKRTPVTIRRIEGTHGLAGMLLSFGDLGTFRIEGLQADIAFDTDRSSNLTGLLLPPPEPAAVTRPSAPKRSPIRVRLRVEDAVARIEGPWAAEPWVSDPTDLEARLAPAADGASSEWTLSAVQLLDHARLEANVAQGVLAYIAPVLADATRTSGRFSLKLDGATFPVGDPRGAKLSGVLSMHEVDLGPGPLASSIIGSLPGRLQLPESIRVADGADVEFRLADRRVWHKGLEFGLPLAKPGQRLDINSSGSVGLDDKSLDLKFSLPVPADLPADRPLLAALAGKSISIGIGGVLGEPKVNFDGSIRAAAGDVVADLVDRLRTPERTPAKQPMQPQDDARPQGNEQTQKQGNGDSTAEAIVDLVGGVLDEVAKRRAERAAAAAANPDAQPPRRGGLLRRLAPPPQSQPAPQPAPAP